ncbi:fibronectin type III domain-containing protein, partial [bacterium]|nr:fibronectin type III domain-containing protein [bacterium]
YHISNSTESIFYMINRFFMSAELRDAVTAATPGKQVEGWFDSFDANANIKNILQGDHTARDWNDLSATEGHHKVMIFDMDIVAFGSANHTYGSMRDSGGSANVENLILIYDFRLGRKYMREYRRSMALIPSENVGQADSFEEVAPGAVTNLAAVDVVGTSNQLQISWTGPSNSDLSRYYVFISPTAITAQRDIGDGLDNDGDGYIDEDPVGDADGFSSGVSSLTANNDDADGSTDEDPWLYPEAQVKNQTAGASIVTTLSTVNVGDVLQDNTNYWVAVVAVDKHGNESPVSIVGPVQSLPALPGAKPAASVAFDSGASNLVSTASTLALSVGNDVSAARPITRVVVDLGSVTLNSETASVSQTPPSSWSVSKSGNILTYTASLSSFYIDAGETLIFKIAVTNAPNTGPATNLLVSTTDDNSVTISNIDAGFVTLVSAPPVPPAGATNNVLTMTAADGVNTISTFGGTEKLLKADITLTYTVANAPNTGTSVWWDVDKNPDGPGGSATDKQVASSGSGTNFSAILPGSTDPSIRDGVQIRFLVQIDNETHANSGNFYRFTIDDTVTLPSGLSILASNFTDITVGWNAIPDSDFLQYDIFYSSQSPVTLSDPSVTVTTRTQTSVQISGLTQSTTYYFAIQSRDLVGNVSGLSPQISGATQQGTNVSVANATDGTKQITAFDGTGTLSDNAITVSFSLDKLPAKSSDVQLWYDVGDNPDGPGGSNTQDRQIFASGSGLQWQAVIPGSDAEIVDQAIVKFVFVIGGQVIQLSGVPYRFKVLRTITEAPSNFTITDTTGTGFSFTWTPLSVPSNFHSYRIYYATDTVTLSSSIWDRDDDVALYFAATGWTTMNVLSPNTQYRFKIAGVDGLGNVGPLSSPEIVGTTGVKGAVLMTEVGIEESPEFIELEAITGPLDISSFQITDLDAAPVTLAGSALTLQKGSRAVIWLAAGVDETDGVGDANGNGYRDVYVTPGPSLAAATDEVVLLSSTGDTIDAVVYVGSKLDNIDATDLAALTPTHWSGTDSSGAVRAFTTVAYQRTPGIARKKDVWGVVFSDLNARNDWEAVTDTTPGVANAFMTVGGISLSDTSPVGDVRTATVLSGGDRLKGGPYRLKLTLSQVPVVSGGLKFWYDTNASPDGRSAAVSTDAPISISLPAGSRTVDTDVSIPEAQHGREIRFIFTSENDPANPDALDEIRMTRAGGPYRFVVDLLGPDTPGGLKIMEKIPNGFVLSWTPISNPGDFASYVVYYDTGAVTTASKSWASAQAPLLANIAASSTFLSGLASGTYYHFRLATRDALGNLSGFSDTASETTVTPVLVNEVTASDGVNVLNSFFGTGKLLNRSAKITVTFDRLVTNPVLYWNTTPSAPADGPGGNSDTTTALVKVTSNQYSCTLPALSHDTTVLFVFSTAAGVIKNGSAAFSYKVDGRAGDSVSQFKFADYMPAGLNRNTSIWVTWSPLLVATYPDFLEYRVHYQRGETVTVASAGVWGPAKAPILADIRAGGTAVQGLAANETYTFAASWIDRTGNQAALSDTFTVVTVNAVPYEDPATDGVNIAHVLDGTEWLMKKDITVTFEFSAPPMHSSAVVLKWNVGAAAGAGQSRAIQMAPRSWNPLIYDGVILAETDPLIVDGSMVQYALWADGLKFDNSGVDFKFLVDATPPPALTGVNVWDDTSSLTVLWNPTGMSDFSTYRIRYRPSTSGAWTWLDKSKQSILGNKSASNLTFPVSATAHYYVNAAAVDQASHEAWQPVDKVILRGAASLDPALTEAGPTLIPVVAGSPVTLSVKLWDLNGNGWSGQSISFNLSGDTGGLNPGRNKSLSVVSGTDGLATATLYPDAAREFYIVTASSAAAPASKVRFILFSLPDERLKNATKIYVSENL